MKFSELSAEDQALVNSQFPEEIEKSAAEEVQLFQELYTVGSEKLAAEAADAFDKLAEEKEKEEKEKEEEPEMGEELHKKAAEMGAVIERAQFDGLRKLGSERHNDEWYYIRPMVEEKVASVKERIMAAAGKVKAQAGKAVAGYKGHLGAMKGHASGAVAKGKSMKERGGHALGLGKHLSPYAGAAALGAGAYHMGKKKKED